MPENIHFRGLGVSSLNLGWEANIIAETPSGPGPGALANSKKNV